MKKLLSFAFVILALAAASFGQKMMTPKVDSTDHKAIIVAIKEYDVSEHDEFEVATYDVNTMRVQGMWAFASVEPKLQGDGESLDYGVGHVFLKKTGTTWKVVFSTNNEKLEMGLDGLTKVKKDKTFPKELATFAESQLAG